MRAVCTKSGSIIFDKRVDFWELKIWLVLLANWMYKGCKYDYAGSIWSDKLKNPGISPNQNPNMLYRQFLG